MKRNRVLQAAIHTCSVSTGGIRSENFAAHQVERLNRLGFAASSRRFKLFEQYERHQGQDDLGIQEMRKISRRKTTTGWKRGSIRDWHHCDNDALRLDVRCPMKPIKSGVHARFYSTSRRSEMNQVAKSLFEGVGQGKISWQRACEEARLLLEYVEEVKEKGVQVELEVLMRRRIEDDEPVNHLVKKAYFWTLCFEVNRDVLIPRPCSEVLVESAVGFLKRGIKSPSVVVDLGTGSGCLLLSTLHEVPHSFGIGLDISSKALDVAKRNAQAIGLLPDRCTFVEADLTKELTRTIQAHMPPSLNRERHHIDVIICNPPYISSKSSPALPNFLDDSVLKYEPHIALFGGPDGLEIYRQLFRQLDELVKHGLIRPGQTTLLLEIGFNQAKQVVELAHTETTMAKFRSVEVKRDLSQLDRCVIIEF